MISLLIIVLSFIGIAVALYYAKSVTSVPIDGGADNEEEASKLRNIHKAIADGAMAFLTQEYKYMFVFIATFAFIIGILINDPHTPTVNEGIYTAIVFVLGCLISILSGFIGMKIATAGNVRTAAAAKESISKAFYMALHSGAVMGFALVGLAGLGLIFIYLGLEAILPADIEKHILMDLVAGFGLGGSSIALFARVGGGIFTKAADVGADLVGKVEKGIPEDDPRNPAVIADNVGDNVGDVAGMGADLFGSCAESTCAAMVIGATAFATDISALLFPIFISALGIPISLITMFLISVKTEQDVAKALKRLLIISSVLLIVAMYFATMYFIPDTFQIGSIQATNFDVFLCYLIGLLSGLFIGLLTEYYTSHDFTPVQDISKSCETGVATNVIFGLALGFKSTGGILLMIALSVFIPFSLAGMYGIALSSLGMLGTLVIGLTIDAYGPVADNAGGIAEMCGLGKKIRERTDVLDSSGNTTAAIGKGFAIGSAILTSLALYAAFLTRAEQLSGISYTTMQLLNPMVLFGLFLGTILPFLFSAMTMRSVGSAAFEMIEEVRRQFRENPGIFEGTAKPDYKRCVAISTKAALREMIPPGALIILSPIVCGLLLGIEAVAGLLMGSLLVGAGMAIFQSNAGGAWDNAKKYIEKGNHGGKGSEAHKAAVIGDTVGDPLKDTSGPSLNILMKLSAILSLVFVPFFINYGGILLKWIGQ